jgi:hypothetical protein
VLRLAAAHGLVAVLAWCCLLFGIGLDDLTNDHSEPGVIFSVVVLPIFIAGALYGIARLVRRRAPTRPDREPRRLG